MDWRGPQTQQRDFCISLLLRVYGKPKWLEDFVDRERIDRVTPSVCGRHGRSVSPPALRALCPAKDWLVDGLSRTSFSPFLARASLVFFLAHKGCGRRCVTLIGKGSGSISTSHSGKSELCVQRAGITSGSRQASTSSLWSTWRSPGTILCSPLCPLMLALHAMSFLSGLSGVRHGSGACNLVGGFLKTGRLARTRVSCLPHATEQGRMKIAGSMLYHGRYGPASRSTEIWTFLEDDVRCAAWFNSGYTLTRQSTFPPAVNCSGFAPRSSGKFGCLRR